MILAFTQKLGLSLKLITKYFSSMGLYLIE